LFVRLAFLNINLIANGVNTLRYVSSTLSYTKYALPRLAATTWNCIQCPKFWPWAWHLSHELLTSAWPVGQTFGSALLQVKLLISPWIQDHSVILSLVTLTASSCSHDQLSLGQE